MLFNSFAFLASFAAFAALYYVTPHRYRWPLLLAASLGYYATFRVAYVVLLLAVSAVAYIAAIAMGGAQGSRKRVVFAGGVVLVLGALTTFKYVDFFAASVDAIAAGLGAGASTPLLPRLNLAATAGLSFYAFSCVSYLADVYAGRLQAERHAGYFVLYVSFFPKLLAGPIERAGAFLARLRTPVAFSDAGVTLGLQMMLWGLFKKVVIADRLAPFVDRAYGQTAFAPPADLLIATYFFAFQLYCDFSGYSDLAIGSAKVLGFDLMENFRRPYLATSVPEFWAQRWHISLSSWFRDYLYIPLGGGRVSRVRRACNVMAVFLASGLWHGANWTFVVWGGLNGLFAVATTTIAAASPPSGARRALVRAASVLLTFHLVLITWVFFRAATIADALLIIQRVAASAVALPSMIANRFSSPDVWGSAALIAVLMAVEGLDELRSIWDRVRASPVYVRWPVYYALLLCLLLLGAWNLQQFVYMQF